MPSAPLPDSNRAPDGSLREAAETTVGRGDPPTGAENTEHTETDMPHKDRHGWPTDGPTFVTTFEVLGTLGLLGIVIIGNLGQVFFLLGITDEKCH